MTRVLVVLCVIAGCHSSDGVAPSRHREAAEQLARVHVEPRRPTLAPTLPVAVVRQAEVEGEADNNDGDDAIDATADPSLEDVEADVDHHGCHLVDFDDLDDLDDLEPDTDEGPVILDVEDRCPEDPEDRDAFEDDGCPEPE
jgi:hypothetical protein